MHGIVHGHRPTFVAGSSELLGRQHGTDRLHSALVGDALVDRPCAPVTCRNASAAHSRFLPATR
jgi:hypothetical protein